ncbi:MAG: transcriptional regulator [Clostridiales bacterium]|jgi:DNA-binding MarR family transcriptional regulator|nr:transcriptional regulator [Clostridiales bacterium]
MDILDKQKFIFGSIFLLANKLQVLGDQYFAENDMTVKQWLLTVMILQFQDGPPTLSQVAELMGSSRQNVKQIALKLEKKGLLTIEKDDQDARVIRLKITEKSYSFWEKRVDKDEQYVMELFKDLSKEETDAMYSGVGKLFEKIK